jgi:radical SAM superfamily enzyme YgiQ (UPF0313 family)
MKILLVSPEFPNTFWGFKYALRFIGKKAPFPPLGLITVAALLPEHWEKKLVDLNIESLTDEDILWADYLFLGAMHVQKESVLQVIARSKKLGTRIVAGGPLFTSQFDQFSEVDHLVLNEAEITLPEFIKDLGNGSPKHLYQTSEWADITKTPIPLWELVDIRKYASLNVQYSRGCPYDCEFCDITVLYGRRPRTKSTVQMLDELERIYQSGWRHTVFIVDDNFIGNKRKLKSETLPTIIDWMKQHKYPFSFITEASLNLADDAELKDLMVRAGFNTVFIGIESPNENSLAECNKTQNRNRNIIEGVKKIQQAGLQVQGGFILGFDNDTPSSFEEMISFIQESGIVTAMVGLLTAFKGTRLFKRLSNENRLRGESQGNNTAIQLNFIPKMNENVLIEGYKNVVKKIYSPKEYYRRLRTFLKEYKPMKRPMKFRLRFHNLEALIKIIVILGIASKGRSQFWMFLIWSIFHKPRQLQLALTLTIFGFHFRKTFQEI